MNKKIIIILSLFLIFSSLTLVSAHTNETDTTNTDIIEIQDIKSESITPIKTDDEKIEIVNQQTSDIKTENKIQKTAVKEEKTAEKKDNTLIQFYKNKSYAGNTTELTAYSSINGSLDFYINKIFVGNAPIINKYSKINYTIPDDYSGDYEVYLRHRNQKNQLTKYNITDNLTVMPIDTVLLVDNMGPYFPIEKTKTIKLCLTNIKGEILNETGRVNIQYTYPLPHFTGGYEFETIDLGNKKMVNGVSEYNFSITYPGQLDSYPWTCSFNYTFFNDDFSKVMSFYRGITLVLYEDMLPDWSVITTPDLKPVPTVITSNNLKAYAGQSVTFKGSVVDEYNTPVKEGKIAIKINGRTITSNVHLNNTNNFAYQYKIPANYTIKTYTLTFVYGGTKNYSRSESNNTLRIITTPSQINANNIAAYAGETINFSGNITDKNLIPITTGRVVIKINGKTLKKDLYLDNSNKFSYTYTVPGYQAKNYTLTYVFINKNGRSELNRTLTIKPQESVVTANNMVNYKNQVVKLTVQIKGKQTGLKAVKGTVGFKINGKTVQNNGKPYILNITNGKVTFTYKIPTTLKADKYQITVTYSGGRYLEGARTNTSTLIVKDNTTKITIKAPKTKAGETVRILAAVNDTNGKIRSGNATFKLNGKLIGTSNITAGAAVLYYTIPANYLGSYTIEVIAQGTYTNLNSTKTTLTVVN